VVQSQNVTRTVYFKGTPRINVIGASTSSYDQNGNLVAVDDANENTLDRQIANDAAGRALRVTQNGNKLYTHIVNGEMLGRHGVAPNEVDPRTANNQVNFAQVAKFEFGYQHITGSYPSAAIGQYTVRQGDTLQSIAQAAFGDSRQWWRIAEANGLASERDLRVGQTLTLPSHIAGESNTSSTFKPYNPSDVVGDTSPNLPVPGNDDGCGGIGMILVIIVAIVVTVLTAGAAAAAMGAVTTTTTAGVAATAASSMTAWAAGTAALTGGFGAGVGLAAGAIGAAVGSVVSQGVAIAAGLQEDFSWKQVGLAAIGGAISGGLAGYAAGAGGAVGTALRQVVVRAAISNAMTQGIAVAAGIQEKFDWRGVAASAVGAGVGQAVGGAMGMNDPGFKSLSFGQQFGARLVTGLAAGAATAVMRGGRIAVQQIAVDAFGNALGDSLVDAMQPRDELGDFINEKLAEQERRDRYGIASASNARYGLSRPSTVRLGGYVDDDAPMETPLGNRGLLNAAERASNPSAYISVAGSARVAVAGDNVSTMLGTSSPQAIGNFMRANNLSSSDIQGGRNYFIPESVTAYGDAAALGQAALDRDNRRLETLARERFNFSDGVDAKDIRLSFGYQSRMSRALSDLAPSGAGASPYAFSGAVMKPVSGWDSFVTSNPVGRAWRGYSEATWSIIRSPVTAAEGLWNLGQDAYGYSREALFGPSLGVLGDVRYYEPQSALARSIERDGIAGTVGNVIVGGVRSLPGVAQVDALYRGDAYALGSSLPSTGLAVAGGMALGRGPGALYTYGDHLRPVLGPATLSHADEVASIMRQAESMGIGVRYETGRLAYEPALRSGNPGTMILDPDASIGALRHEWRHALDDASMGHPGFRLMADSDAFWRLEYRGYMEEIKLARQTRNFDVGRQIVGEMRARRGEILGF